MTTLSARCEKTFRPSADQLETIEKTPSADIGDNCWTLT